MAFTKLQSYLHSRPHSVDGGAPVAQVRVVHLTSRIRHLVVGMGWQMSQEHGIVGIRLVLLRPAPLQTLHMPTMMHSMHQQTQLQ